MEQFITLIPVVWLMPADQNLLDKIQMLIDLKAGDVGRLEHIKQTIILGNQLYNSDKIYLDNILQKNSLTDSQIPSDSFTAESKKPEITKSELQPEAKTGENISYKTSNQMPLKDRKGLRLTTILAFLIMGVGHIYVGETKRGIILLVIGMVLGTLSSGLAAIGELMEEEYLIGSGAYFLLGIAAALGLALIVLWIWQIFNARTACRKYNSQLE